MKATGPSMCKLCGHHHYRYDPHIWDEAADEAPHSNARSRSRRTPDSQPVPAPKEAGVSEPKSAARPGTPDTQPSANLVALSDDNLIKLRNAVMQEYMRRHRKEDAALKQKRCAKPKEMK